MIDIPGLWRRANRINNVRVIDMMSWERYNICEELNIEDAESAVKEMELV